MSTTGKVNTMSAIVTSPSVERPLTVVNQAVAWAKSRGINVRLGEYGIECAGKRRWWLMPGAAGCDPLGAVVLMRQPLPTTLPQALTAALNVPEAWIEGFNDGADKNRPAVRWLASPQRHLYLEAYEDGLSVRTAFLSALCVAHNVRHRRGEPCPMCEEQALAERDGGLS